MKRLHHTFTMMTTALLLGLGVGCGAQAPTSDTLNTQRKALVGAACTKNSNCGANEYCKYRHCEANSGTCAAKPLFCPISLPFGQNNACTCNRKPAVSVCRAAQQGLNAEPGACPAPGAQRQWTWVTRIDRATCTGRIPNGLGGTKPVYNTIFPLVGENGHYAGVKLTPKASQYPFTVTGVRYNLRQTNHKGWFSGCNSGLGQEVFVFVTKTNEEPKATPAVLARLQVPELRPNNIPQNTTTRVISLQLPSPIQLKTGESLFLAIQARRKSENNLTCFAVCEGQGDPKVDYWSNATQAPYPWASLQSFDLDGGLFGEMYGFHYPALLIWQP